MISPDKMVISEQFAKNWLLLPDERALLIDRTAHGRIGIALLLKFFQQKGNFPARRNDIPQEAVSYMADQIGVSPSAWHNLAWGGGMPLNTII